MPQRLDQVVYYDENLDEWVGWIIAVNDAENVRVFVISAEGATTAQDSFRVEEPTAYGWMLLS